MRVLFDVSFDFPLCDPIGSPLWAPPHEIRVFQFFIVLPLTKKITKIGDNFVGNECALLYVSLIGQFCNSYDVLLVVVVADKTRPVCNG